MPSSAPLRWTCATLDQLSPRALYEALVLRSQVFVVEQHCVFLDPDGDDPREGAWHLLGHGPAGELQVYARLLAPGCRGPHQPNPRITRVVSSPAFRGTGLGPVLMQRAIAECESRWPGWPIDINAQAQLQRFYEGQGFVVTSAPYDEDGISHIDMRRPAP